MTLAISSRALTWTIPPAARHRLLTVALLVAATLLLYGLVQQYRVVGPELLHDRSFDNLTDTWRPTGQITARDGVLQLSSADATDFTGVEQLVPTPDAGYYQISGEVMVEGVHPGLLNWQRARLVLATYDAAAQPRWQIPHMLALPNETSGWISVTATFRVPERSSAISASAQLVNTPGVLRVRDLSLRRVEPVQSFIVASRTLLGIWILAGLWILWPIFGRARRDPGVALAVLAGIVFYGLATMPQPAKIALLQQIDTLAPQFFEGTLFASYGIDKVGHFLAHVAVGFLAFRAFRELRPEVLLLYLLVFAGVSEVLQNFSIDRDPMVSDALINSSGIVLGTVLQQLWARVIVRRG